jgi:hypothetical protein
MQSINEQAKETFTVTFFMDGKMRNWPMLMAKKTASLK